ncbi:cell division protein ZapA [Prosthecomicrobium pneumaticum]|uniref:Cell division protein ZapA n=1 Tax=Prosthecomicrobium pneumaticum TaxID=81895 RepID=A0A7W9FKF9_9HYPH|nr:cell division protein ZapA [Prosthecomicrobium pneumaticum]MBB5752621.1 cell division protein ZapA [Prosthecomicrobium pneumaticum]
MAQVSVTINGKIYRMACDDGQEHHLEALARRVDGTIDQLRQAFGEIGDQRLTVMAAITLSDELAEAQRRIRRLETEIAGVNDTKVAIATRYEDAETAVARAVDSAAQRLEGLAQRLSLAVPRALD